MLALTNLTWVWSLTIHVVPELFQLWSMSAEPGVNPEHHQVWGINQKKWDSTNIENRYNYYIYIWVCRCLLDFPPNMIEVFNFKKSKSWEPVRCIKGLVLMLCIKKPSDLNANTLWFSKEWLQEGTKTWVQLGMALNQEKEKNEIKKKETKKDRKERR